MTLTKVQAVTKAYKTQASIQRSRPANQSAFEDPSSHHRNFHSRHEDSKSFAQILKDQMKKA